MTYCIIEVLHLPSIKVSLLIEIKVPHIASINIAYFLSVLHNFPSQIVLSFPSDRSNLIECSDIVLVVFKLDLAGDLMIQGSHEDRV